MPYRYSMIFQLTTEPANRIDANAHSGGWSESFWDQNNLDFSGESVKALATARARLLPKQASIVGLKKAAYVLQGNKLIPGGTQAVRTLYTGNALFDCDLPQAALMLGITGNTGNATRVTLRGMPDEFLVRGEYAPSAVFKGFVTQYANVLTTGVWDFLGRDLTQLISKIASIDNGVMKLKTPMIVNVGDYVRILKCRDIQKKKVAGSFRVTAVADGGSTVTLDGLPAGLSVKESGSARRDMVGLSAITSAVPVRAVVRKIGRPFEQYRGRQSKR